jgi:quinol-cytochrome oxidoreductase complex cytochrome b subunit
MKVLRTLCYGQYSLPIAFWVFGVGGVVIGTVATMVLANLTILDATRQRQPFYAIWVVGLLIFYAYIFFVAIGVWNSAGPGTKSEIVMERIGAYATRFIVFGYTARLIFRLLNGGAVNLLNLITR